MFPEPVAVNEYALQDTFSLPPATIEHAPEAVLQKPLPTNDCTFDDMLQDPENIDE